MRSLARTLADEGRTVFVSSHHMGEMALMADHVIIIGRGRVLSDRSMTDFVAEHAVSTVLVRTPDLDRARALLEGPDVVVKTADGALHVHGLEPSEVGDALFAGDVRVHELSPQLPSLEDAFISLTAGSVQFHTTTPEGASA